MPGLGPTGALNLMTASRPWSVRMHRTSPAAKFATGIRALDSAVFAQAYAGLAGWPTRAMATVPCGSTYRSVAVTAWNHMSAAPLLTASSSRSASQVCGICNVPALCTRVGAGVPGGGCAGPVAGGVVRCVAGAECVGVAVAVAVGAVGVDDGWPWSGWAATPAAPPPSSWLPATPGP